MKRRDALKNIGLSAGLIVATPTVISLLNSCSTDSNKWSPVFLNKEQAKVLMEIVDVIIPKTDTPSANEVNVVEFLDKYYKEILDDNRQDWLKNTYAKLVDLIKLNYSEDINSLTQENYKDLLDNHMILNGESDDISELLKKIKSDTIWSYKISEFVGENVLAYDPIPGVAYCGDLQELTGGKSWSL
ncbi:MAG: gluconate 2-dehydrogenase [Flavobacteriaceae bacterium]|mgnify:FL=1|jgi:hypothetical protein|nr:gluconate 2-dehydrogenase [Flavobacteriaceae bacterium]MEE2616374.1 gluconate 2-dehydrogenase subunit 3 family protein [Bacteroidota bacterium]|tara:strand:- start:163 stop:723 length:561 start_codon:yes stop_codon:yes gene_type:complete